MTKLRHAAAGAILLNVPTIFVVSVLPTSTLAITAVLVATIGAVLGVVTGWAISSRIDAAVAAVAVVEAEPVPVAERLAA